MSNAKHTPGPWVKDGMDWVGSNGEKVVMSGGGLAFGSSAIWPSAEANALLIAVAPELLEACEKVQECLKNHNKYSHLGNGYLEEADGIITAAIAKARGE